MYVQPRYLTYLLFIAGWVEESFTNFDKGINWRSYVVCDVGYPNVNNWLWTPFIERGEANRIYIEVNILVFQEYRIYNWTIGHLKLSSKFNQQTMEVLRIVLSPLIFKVKFSLRNCDLFPGTALQCKETFSLLFYEFDAAIHQVEMSFNSSDRDIYFYFPEKYIPLFYHE